MHTYRAHPDVSVLGDYLEVPGLGFLPVNAFVIHAAQPVVVDSGLELADRDFLAQAIADVPRWRLRGDWFDVCNCTIPCPCYFAQAPTFGDCEGTLAWHIREGRYGDVVSTG